MTRPFRNGRLSQISRGKFNAFKSGSNWARPWRGDRSLACRMGRSRCRGRRPALDRLYPQNPLLARDSGGSTLRRRNRSAAGRHYLWDRLHCRRSSRAGMECTCSEQRPNISKLTREGTEYNTAVETGLSSAAATRRLREEGPNEIARPEHRTAVRIIIDVFREPMFALLVGAGILYLF